MAYELIISEKPSAAKKLAEALADGKPVQKKQASVSWWLLSHNKKDLVIAAAAGHLYGVAEKGDRTYQYPVYDIEWKPNAEVDKNSAFSKKYITVLKKLAKDATSFTVATDYDIEGETIGLNIIRFICKQKDANRMKFSTLTKDELRDSYTNKQKTLDWGQANAGETRHFLDWMYGINLSRALMASIKAAGSFKVLSIGRVQGPALKMVIDREKEIAAFTPEPYWQIELQSEKDKKEIVAWHATDKFWKEDEAKTAFGKAKEAKDATVKKVDAKSFKQQPPHPFDLGSLQTEAYRCFKIKPKQTLEVAQKLYTDGSISYPRTSSQKLPAKLGYKKILTALSKNKDYASLAGDILKLKTLKPNEGKKSDPAHPAIHPTGQPVKGKDWDLKIYDLIVKRFLATFAEPATRETVTAHLDANTEPFVAKGTRTTAPGWHLYYAPYVNLKEEELPKLQENESLPITKLDLHEKETQPPKRYTQSSIINELEKRNLGTKATRADVVEALFKRNYVKGDANIEGTELGMEMVKILEKHSPEIIDEALTRQFEEEMEEIQAQKKNGEQILNTAKKELDKLLAKFKKNEKEVGEELIAAYREEQDMMNTLGPCIKCKQGTIKVTFSKKTRKRFCGCDRYPDCDQTYPLPQKGMIQPTDKQCEHCQAPMIMIGSGRRKQLVCINNECPQKLKEEKDAQQEADAEGTCKICPKCEKKLVLRKSVYGAFWGCSGFPKCRHTEPANGNHKSKDKK